MESLPWSLLNDPKHKGIYDCLRDLNQFYLTHPALHVEDFSKEGFEWVINDAAEHQVLAYLRKGGGETLLCIHHFSLSLLEEYFVPAKGKKEIFTTDLKEYGGCGIINSEITQTESGMKLTLPPLTTIILSV